LKESLFFSLKIYSLLLLFERKVEGCGIKGEKEGEMSIKK
jgi:hypothetical protein